MRVIEGSEGKEILMRKGTVRGGYMFSILLVEDEKLELETLRDYVDWKKLGASRVYTARNGRAALECLEEHDPDIMITDIQLPVMDGIELSKRAREEGFGCKIVFLTGYDNFEYMKSAFQVQAVDYILKPFRVDEVEALTLRIREQLEKERMAERSVRFASGQVFVVACEQEEADLEELSRKYLSVSADEKAFGLLAVYGIADDKLTGQIENLTEVRHAFYMEGLILTVLHGYVSFEDAAGRIVTALDGKGSVVWCDGRVSLADMKACTQTLLSYRDRMFYGEPGEILCVPEKAGLRSGRFDRELWKQKGQKLYQSILSGSGSEEVAGALSECMQELRSLGREECQREAYGLYLNLYNRLELDNASLMGEMEKREYKPELLIWNTGFFADVQEALWQYVEKLYVFFEKQRENPNYYVTNWVRDYLEKNYMRVCSVEEMAEGIHLSPNYLRSRFKAGTGQTILEYMTDFRLQKACLFLKDKSLKVKDVSLMVGYENVSYFSQIFAKRYGVTPNEYRKMV